MSPSLPSLGVWVGTDEDVPVCSVPFCGLRGPGRTGARAGGLDQQRRHGASWVRPWAFLVGRPGSKPHPLTLESFVPSGSQLSFPR